MEFRQEMSSFVRKYAINQFEKEYALKDKRSKAHQQVLGNISEVKEFYRPRRYYRRKYPPTSSESLSTRVQMTLLEYGHFGVQKSGSSKVSQSSDKTDEQTEGVNYFYNFLLRFATINIYIFVCYDFIRLLLCVTLF